MNKYLAGRFSLYMLEGERDSTLIRVRPIKPEDIPNDVINCIKQPHLTRVVGDILGIELKCSTQKGIRLKKNDVLYVAQCKGKYLSQDATKLPEGTTIHFFEITFLP